MPGFVTRQKSRRIITWKKEEKAAYTKIHHVNFFVQNKHNEAAANS